MNRRILVIDDQEEVLKDYQEILSPRCLTDEKISQLEAELFGKKSCQTSPAQPAYEVYLARQGKEGYEIAKKMKEAGLSEDYIAKYKQSRLIYNTGFTACGVILLYELLI